MEAPQRSTNDRGRVWIRASPAWLIVLLLSAYLAIEYVWPWVVLERRGSDYLDAAVLCHEALSNLDEIRGAAGQFDPPIAQALLKSAMIGSLDCYERQSLRSYLLAQGVNPSNLDAIDMAAGLSSRSDLPHVVDGLVKR